MSLGSTRVHLLRSTCDVTIIRRINSPPPPASDFRICTKLRIFAVPVFRCSGILLFRCSGVPVLRCSAVPGFTNSHFLALELRLKCLVCLVDGFDFIMWFSTYGLKKSMLWFGFSFYFFKFELEFARFDLISSDLICSVYSFNIFAKFI